MGTYQNFIKMNGKQGIEISKYNNIIVPYIGTEIFNIETVEYLFAKFSRGKQKIPVNPNMEYLLTIDEKANGEEVWEGLNILSSEDIVSFSERLAQISKFLELRHISMHKIQEVMDELIRQEIFKKTVEYKDNHNGNWAIGIRDRNPRVFPAYDFDFCSGIQNVKTCETLLDNGKADLKSLIMQYRNLPWIKTYIEEVIHHFDMERVFKISYEKTQISLPEYSKQYFENFYSEKKKELEQIYQAVLQDRPKGDDEICV